MPLGKGLVMTEAEKLRIHKLSQEGLGYKKIAAALALPVNSVKTYLRRHPAGENAAAVPDICERCGKPIIQTPHRKRKRFCSDSCRISWWNDHPDKGGKRTLYTFNCASIVGARFKAVRKSGVTAPAPAMPQLGKKAVSADG